MNKAIIKQEQRLSRNFKMSMTTKNIADKLLTIMQGHIGFSNAISRRALFYKVFRKSEDDSSLEDWLRWEFVKKAMHLCRVRTKCFISSCRDDSFVYRYFVVNSEEDTEHYIKMLENSIKRMRVMQQRCRKAGQEKWGSLPEWTNRGFIE